MQAGGMREGSHRARCVGRHGHLRHVCQALEDDGDHLNHDLAAGLGKQLCRQAGMAGVWWWPHEVLVTSLIRWGHLSQAAEQGLGLLQAENC